MDLLKHTLYINLDYRTDRLEHVQEELDKICIKETAERFPAVKMEKGNVGCTLSHIRCIDLAKSRGWPHVFICEDDITFTDPATFLESLHEFSQSVHYWNVIVIGGNNCPPFDPISSAYARVYNIQTTTGYIVNSNYYDILLNNFKEGLSKLMREPDKKKQFSLDIYWKTLQTTGLWYMITPPTVIQYYDYSDIEEKVVDYGPMMLDLEKKELMEKYMKKIEEEKIEEQRKRQFFSMSL
jgi:glycosyl transferase family 25